MSISKEKLIYDEMSEKIIENTELLVKEDGAKNVTVSRILNRMGINNRVFYNRFHNIDEVLEIIYSRTILKMRESVNSKYDIKTDFYNYVMDVAKNALYMTYDLKNQFSQFMFEFDSYSEPNRIWWINKIKEIIEIAKSGKILKDVDSELLSYSIWCFLRGYNADAVKRKLSKEEAARSLKFGMDCMFYGILLDNKNPNSDKND